MPFFDEDLSFRRHVGGLVLENGRFFITMSQHCRAESFEFPSLTGGTLLRVGEGD